MSKEQAYEVGDWFAVPVGDHRWVVGLLTHDGGGHVVYAYFFAPSRDRAPDLEEVTGLSPADAFLHLVFSDLALLDGRWPVIGPHQTFDPSSWPTVEHEKLFDSPAMREPKLYAIRYGDDLIAQVERRRVPLEERGQRPRASLSGSRAAEVGLILGLQALGEDLPLPPSAPTPPDEARGTVRHFLYVPQRLDAEALAAEIQQAGHEVEVRAPNTGDDEWLVLVTDAERYSPELLDKRERDFDILLTRVGGTYDGNEIAG